MCTSKHSRVKVWREVLILILPLLLIVSCNSSDSKNIFILDSSPKTVEIFGEHWISTQYYERDIAISKSGDEIIYSLGDYKQNKRFLVSTTQIEGKWSEPAVMSFSGIHQDIEPFFSPKLDRVYFASNRPMTGDSERSDYNIWYSDRQNGEWLVPVPLDSIINTEGDEFYPSLSANGNLYFTATRKDGIGSEDIFRSVYENGKFASPVALDSTINTKTFEFNAYINPEENLLVFSSYGRKDGFGGGDLYYSKMDDNGKWLKAKNMGAIINSEKLDFCPFIDWNNNNFYFTSEKMNSTNNAPMKIEELKEFSNNPFNGFGNIFRVSLTELNLD